MEKIGEVLDIKTKMPANAGWKQVAEFGAAPEIAPAQVLRSALGSLLKKA